MNCGDASEAVPLSDDTYRRTNVLIFKFKTKTTYGCVGVKEPPFVAVLNGIFICQDDEAHHGALRTNPIIFVPVIRGPLVKKSSIPSPGERRLAIRVHRSLGTARLNDRRRTPNVRVHLAVFIQRRFFEYRYSKSSFSRTLALEALLLESPDKVVAVIAPMERRIVHQLEDVLSDHNVLLGVPLRRRRLQQQAAT